MYTPYFQRRLHSEVQGKHLFVCSVSVSERKLHEDRDSVCLFKCGPRQPALLITEYLWAACKEWRDMVPPGGPCLREGSHPGGGRDRIERNTSEEIKKEKVPNILV